MGWNYYTPDPETAAIRREERKRDDIEDHREKAERHERLAEAAKEEGDALHEQRHRGIAADERDKARLIEIT